MYYLSKARELQNDRYNNVIKNVRDKFNIVKQTDIAAIRAVPSEVVCSELLNDFRHMRERQIDRQINQVCLVQKDAEITIPKVMSELIGSD